MTGKKNTRLFVSSIKFLVGLILIWAIIMALFPNPFRKRTVLTMPSNSMAPTFILGDSVNVQTENRGLSRGDIVYFEHPSRSGNFFAKRTIGLPGDTVSIKNNVIEINGVKIW
ncbi:MAG: signal peptidase I [Bacteriovoracia bacterium]